MTEQSYHVKPVTIVCKDEVALSATLFSPQKEAHGDVVVVCSALGVGQSFYHHFAAFLCHNNFCVITFDYRGTEESTALSLTQPRLVDWAVQDMDAVISYAFDLSASGNVFLMGHSIGGQIFCLSEKSKRLKGVILVAASFPYWKRWAFPRRFLMLFFFNLLIPVLGQGRTFPTKLLGLSGRDMPASLIKDWGRWSRHPDYAAAPKFNLDARKFQNCGLPILSFSFDDDIYAPQKAVKRLLSEFKQARIDDIFIDTSQKESIGHFGFFKPQKAQKLWAQTVTWLQARC